MYSCNNFALVKLFLVSDVATFRKFLKATVKTLEMAFSVEALA